MWKEQVIAFLEQPIEGLYLDQGSVKQKTAMAKQYLTRREVQGTTSLVVINYESARVEPFSIFSVAYSWDLVIADEVHRLKKAGGVTSRYASRLSDRVPYRIGMTGTPMPKGPVDLYAQGRFLDKTVFGASLKIGRASCRERV